MRNIKTILILITISMVFIGCRKFKQISPEMKLTEVYVESGNINNLTFVSNGSFKSTDLAIGAIDSVSACVTPKDFNGYVDRQKNVYVFEGGRIPSKIENLGPYLRYLFFSTATWTNPSNFNYILPYDAQICSPPNNYYFRLAGNTFRDETTIRGVKVYRFKESIVEEDYTQILTTMQFLKDTRSPINYFELLSLTPSKYSMESSRTSLKINPQTGTIDLNGSSETPIGTVDKILFRSNNSAINSFRFRTIYKKLTEETRKRYFDTNGNVKDFQIWLNYLQSNVYINFNEKIIEGYTCTKCSNPKGDGRNPPPGMMP